MAALHPSCVWLRRWPPRRPSAVAAAVMALTAAAVGGCANPGDLTGSLADMRAEAPREMPADPAALRAYADSCGKIYDQNPGEKVASINYARALRALTRYKEAQSVMQAAAVKSPTDFEVLGAYGKALTDAGQYLQAKDVLTRAYPPERPDWSIMSVQGAVEDYLGDHERAQSFYREALKIAPGEPAILNNLGLSYALTKRLDLAEKTLREAARSPGADARIRQNLALVLAIDGKGSESPRASGPARKLANKGAAESPPLTAAEPSG